MNDTKIILNKCTELYEDFDYYSIIIDEIEHNIKTKPDVSIESSKSLIEGVCKSILLKLSSSLTPVRVDKFDFHDLFKETCNTLSNHIEFDIDFIRRSTSLVHYLGVLRNKRGDISHGKAVPKPETSGESLAKLVATVTNGIVTFLLSTFLKIDLSYVDEIHYKDNPRFNDFLDENNQIEEIIYSKALFEQDPVAYEEKLSDYLINDNELE
jgi:hypothetical protein